MTVTERNERGDSGDAGGDSRRGELRRSPPSSTSENKAQGGVRILFAHLWEQLGCAKGEEARRHEQGKGPQGEVAPPVMGDGKLTAHPWEDLGGALRHADGDSREASLRQNREVEEMLGSTPRAGITPNPTSSSVST